MNAIKIKPSRNRKPVEPRNCCDTHANNCQFGRQHTWSIGWFGGNGGVGFGADGWHESMVCVTCAGICVAEIEA